MGELDVAEAPSESGGSGPDRLFVRVLLLLVLFGAALAVGPSTPLARWLSAPEAAARWVRELGPIGPALFFLTMSVCIVVGIPRLLFCPVAGALLGFWPGLVASIGATVAGYYAVFLFVRGGGRGLPPSLANHPRLAFLRADPGLPGVVLARLVPLPGMLPNLALATSGVGHRTFLVGTALGLAPEAVPFVLLGSGVLHADASHVAQLGAAGLLLVTVVWLVTRHVLRNIASAAPAVDD